MNESDPFKFFVEVADSIESAFLKNQQAIKDLEDAGIDLGIVKPDIASGKSVSDRMSDSIVLSADDLDGHSNSTYWNVGNVNYYQPSAVYAERNSAINQVDVMLLSLPDAHQMIDKISMLTTSMDNVISKLSRYGDAKHKPLLNTCEEIKSNLQERSRLINHVDKSRRDGTKEKIQWLGQLNVLSTLFYHLLKGQDGGERYISASPETVKRMIANNFIDRDGHEISMETLKTYFTPSRMDKRAKEGDRIELPNKRPKK